MLSFENLSLKKLCSPVKLRFTPYTAATSNPHHKKEATLYTNTTKQQYFNFIFASLCFVRFPAAFYG